METLKYVEIKHLKPTVKLQSAIIFSIYTCLVKWEAVYVFMHPPAVIPAIIAEIIQSTQALYWVLMAH